jgi:hypothetical protein
MFLAMVDIYLLGLQVWSVGSDLDLSAQRPLWGIALIGWKLGVCCGSEAMDVL